MCGIFASTRPDLWVGRHDEVVAALRHRGPDSEGIWTSPDGNALLIQTRLSIIGLGPEGYQPRTAERSALVMNGELYNYRSIARPERLTAPLSDTVVLHDLLDERGAASTDLLRGMYAFAHWDMRREVMTVGRDPWGIKPLYVLRHPTGGHTVSSELPPLTLHSDAREMDPVGLAQYVAFGHTGPEVTCFTNVTKLEPGVCAQLDRDGLRVIHRICQELGTGSELDLDDALADSVAAHFIADVEVGVFLSGGIDSTLIASYAREHYTSLKTFTISFPDSPELDESALATANASRLGTDHDVVPVTAGSMVAALDRFLTCHGEPFGDPAALAVTVLSAHAAHRVKVVQTGEGADEMFGGYRRYEMMHRLDRRAVGHAGRLAAPAAQQWFRHRGDSAAHRSVEALLRGGGADGLAALVDSDLFAVAGTRSGAEVATRLRHDWQTHRGETSGREAARRFDLARWLPNTYLEKTDRATMAHGLEARTPYLDPIVAAAARAPGRAFGKADLRALLERRVPGVELPRVKKGLATPVRLLLAAGLQQSLDRVLHDPSSVLRDVFDPSDIAVLERRSSRSSATAYRLAVLGRWQELGVPR